MPEDKETKLTQAQIAKQTQVNHWNSSVTSLAWHMKPSQKGLQPIRPVVVVTHDINLEPGKILVLQN